MAGGQAWPVTGGAESALRHIDKRLGAQERRRNPASPGSVLGPGMAARSIQILDWNSEVTTFNGFYWSIPGALHAPDPEIPWTGQTIAKDDGSGMQQVWNLDPDYGITTWMRTWVTNATSGAIEYGDWQKFATPSGMIGESELDQPVLDNIQDALDNAASAIVFAEQSNTVFRQADEPVSDTTYTLRENDVWYDSDDGDRPYLYRGGAWVLLEQADAALAQAAADAAHAEAVAAAADAASAIAAASAAQTTANGAVTSANGKTKVYYSNAMPTGGSYNVNDVWFDTDDDNKMYLYNGSSWAAVQFGNAAIADLSITNAKIQDGTIGYAKIGSVDAGAITVGTLDGQRLTGTTVTGMTVQTTTTANRGIKFNSTGFAAYDTGGTATFSLTASSGAVIMTGALLTGGTITGPTFKTTSTASRGVQIDTTGIYAWDSSGVLKFSVSATTGLMTAVNGTFSGFIDSSTVTASTIQTTSTTARGIKMTTTGFVGYDSTGATTFVIDATTGAVTMKGSLTSGSTVTGATVQTNTSGARIVMGPTNTLTFYSGNGSESAPASLKATSGTFGSLTLTGAVNGVGTAPTLDLYVTSGTAKIDASAAEFHTSGGLFIDGRDNGVDAQALVVENFGHAIFKQLNSTDGSDNQASGSMYARVTAAGLICSSTAAPSSRRLKTEIKSLAIDWRKMLDLPTFTYRYKEDPEGTIRAGFMAEDSHDLGGMEAFVSYEDKADPERPTGFDYDGFDAALLEVDKGQQEIIDDLLARIERLEALLATD